MHSSTPAKAGVAFCCRGKAVKTTNPNLFPISLSQFGIAFSGYCVNVLLPFYVIKVSPYSPQETLIWTGWIVGSHHLIMAVASNVWGFLTSRFDPKWVYIRGTLIYTVLFALMGLTSSLPMLLLLRILQGLVGGISTIGLIIVSSSASRERVSADLGFFQTFLTLGMLVGPPIGAYIAAVVGYRVGFIVASALVFAVSVFCYFTVKEVPRTQDRQGSPGVGILNLKTVSAFALCFMAYVQLMFVPSVLPNILDTLHTEKETALQWAGTIIMLYTGTATLGTYVWTKLSVRVGKEKMILIIVLLASLFQAALALSHGMVDFVLLRMAQTGFIAAVLPLVVSMFATEMRGGTIGFLNSGRFAGSALGPIIATSVLALTNFTTLYLLLSLMTILSLGGFHWVSGKKKDPAEHLS